MNNVNLWQITTKFRMFKGSNENSDELIETKKLLEFEGKWKPICLINANEKGKKRRVGDFPSTTGYTHLVSERAANSLEKVFSSSGDLLPVIIEDDDVEENFYLFRCNNVVDCLDVEKSEIIPFTIGNRSYLEVRAPVAIEEKVPDNQLFVVPQDIDGDIYVPLGVRQAVKSHKLKGMVLRPDRHYDGTWVS